MRIRTDLTAFSLTGLVVVAIVVLTALGHDVPPFLTEIGLVTLGVSGGAAAPAHLAGSSSTPPAAPVEAEQPSKAAPRALVADVPAAAPVVPGRDMTESIPKITPDMIAADKAGRA